MTRKKGYFSQSKDYLQAAKEEMTIINGEPYEETKLRLLRANAAAQVALAETVREILDWLRTPWTPILTVGHKPDEAAIVESWAREQDEPPEEVTVELAGVPWTGR